MDFKLYNNVQSFYNDAFDVLMQDEAQNMLILGNLIIGYKGLDTFGWRDSSNWVMCTVSSNKIIRMVAVMTPPFGITLYAVDNIVDENVLKCLIDGLISDDISVPGVVSEKSLSQAFAQIYCTAKNLHYCIYVDQRIYKLTSVNPDIPRIGKMRPAAEADMSFLPYWSEDFRASAGGDGVVSSDAEQYRYLISNGSLFILEDNGTAVSMARISREIVKTAGIAYVYTPPYFRGHGYASSIVAQLSQMWLDKGFNCVLYTDLANPTSNSIYQKIGYRPICDSLDIKFKEEIL